MKKLALLSLALLTSQVYANSSDITTLLKIKSWGGSAPSWNVSGNRSCIKDISYKTTTESKWTNIGSPSEAPRYNFEVKHTPGCNAIITFHWDGSPNDNDHRSDSFARVEMNQYR